MVVGGECLLAILGITKRSYCTTCEQSFCSLNPPTWTSHLSVAFTVITGVELRASTAWISYSVGGACPCIDLPQLANGFLMTEKLQNALLTTEGTLDPTSAASYSAFKNVTQNELVLKI